MKYKAIIPNTKGTKVVIAPPAEFGSLMSEFLKYLKTKDYTLVHRDNNIISHDQILKYNKKYYLHLITDLISELNYTDEWLQKSIKSFDLLNTYGEKHVYMFPETDMHINYQEVFSQYLYENNIDCYVITNSPDMIGLFGDTNSLITFDVIDNNNPLNVELIIQEGKQ